MSFSLPQNDSEFTMTTLAMAWGVTGVEILANWTAAFTRWARKRASINKGDEGVNSLDTMGRLIEGVLFVSSLSPGLTASDPLLKDTRAISPSHVRHWHSGGLLFVTTNGEGVQGVETNAPGGDVPGHYKWTVTEDPACGP